MNRPSIPVSPDILRSRLILPAAIAYLLSALTGLASVALLLVPGSGQVMLEDMLRGGITDYSALTTWQVIHAAVTVINFLWAVMMSLCLLAALTGRAGKGMDLVYHAAQIWLKIVNVTGVCALVLLICRLVSYIIRTSNPNDWLYLVYAMLISEALMVVQAWFLFTLLRRFLNCLCDCAASMGYTLVSARLDQPTIPGFAATGFLILSLFGLGLTFDRFFTVTIVRDHWQDYYALLTAEHPLLRFSAAAFFFGSVGSILISVYLRRYKRTCERLLFQSAKQ